MSLTSILKQKEVQQRFRDAFPMPDVHVSADVVAPLQTDRPGHIGTAFDYLLRFTLRRINSSVVSSSRWTAEVALQLLQGAARQQAEEVIDRAASEVEAYAASGELSEDLLRSCLRLARLDVVVRTRGGYDISEMDAAQPGDLADLKQLHQVIPHRTFEANELCLLNPTFGKASALVRGADADLLIDDLLIDIKTVQKASFTRRMLNQLVGYYILHVIGGIGELDPKPSISRVGIYFARHGHLASFDLDEVIDRETFPDTVEWFARYGLAQRVKENR
jgi:hypothetical protein